MKLGGNGRKNAPCFGCENRSAECHSVCEKYKVAREENAAQKREISRKKYADGIVNYYERDTMRKLKAAKRLR